MNLRMPAELKAAIEESAKREGRSLNGEVVARLQASFEARPFTTGQVAMIRRLIAEELAAFVPKPVGMAAPARKR